MRMFYLLAVVLLAMSSLTACGGPTERDEQDVSPYARWSNGPPADPSWFPVGVWLQNPANAEPYLAAGINVYVGLWQGPTAPQLDALERAGMRVICDQNAVALARGGQSPVIGWMHGDEPDNAQPLPQGGYGPPIDPAEIVAEYQAMREADPSRPVFLNLGQGVAWDGWYGRGVRTNHPEDYPRYLEGTDIASFDIYPAVHDHPDVAGRLEFVARGVERLLDWTSGDQVVWNIVEASRISNRERKPTPAEIRAEVWMSLISGSRGIVYFVHQFEPNFVEASLLSDPVLLPAVTEINQQIHQLAPVLNSPDVPEALTVTSADPAVPVRTLVRRYEGDLYIFAVTLENTRTTVTFETSDATAETAVVLGEDREIAVADGRFSDHFEGYGVHLYRLPTR